MNLSSRTRSGIHEFVIPDQDPGSMPAEGMDPERIVICPQLISHVDEQLAA
jgi:hypothetical protein